MKRLAAAILLLLLSAWPAAAQGTGYIPNYTGQTGQFGGQNPYNSGQGQYLQDYYNRNSQPLSPYLNLLRGGNTAVNYFYGVRPGLMQGAFGSPLNGGQGTLGRQTFFPQVDNLYDTENVGKLDGIPPTGHSIGFRNTLNYFGAGSGASLRPPQPPRQGAASATSGAGVR
jgi:hypothetical protein